MTASANYFIESSAVAIYVDLIFASLVVPLGMLVFGLFWGLKLFSDVICPVPKEGYIKYPLWFDILIHTNVALLPFVDMLISNHKYPNQIFGIALLLAILTCYLIFLLIIHRICDQWVYGIIGEIKGIKKVFFFGALGVVVVVFYLFGEMCNEAATKMKS